MFTGLIADLGSVSAFEPDGDGARLRIATPLAASLAPGDSIAVDGVCLTATQIDGYGGDDGGGGSDDGDGGGGGGATAEFAAEAIAETLRRSTLGALRVGARVNLEPALRADGVLGGHIVQGHVDGTGVVKKVREEGFSRVLTIEPDPPRLTRYMVLKGSVAINGVSLTVSGLCENGFEVSLIPETLQRTNLGGVRAGDRVNVEVDVLAKHVERLLEAHIS